MGTNEKRIINIMCTRTKSQVERIDQVLASLCFTGWVAGYFRGCHMQTTAVVVSGLTRRKLLVYSNNILAPPVF